MKQKLRTVGIFLVTFLSVKFSIAQSQCKPADSIAISKVINEFNDSWTAKDVVRYIAVFAEDADWENAFGGHKRSRDSIQKIYEKLMSQFSTAVETITGIHLFCLSPDFALVDIYQTVDGQKLPKSGKIVPTRHLRMSQIYQKIHGKWQIKVHRVTDLRERGQNQNNDSDQNESKQQTP